MFHNVSAIFQVSNTDYYNTLRSEIIALQNWKFILHNVNQFKVTEQEKKSAFTKEENLVFS